MKKLVAIYCGWLALIVGCSGEVSTDDKGATPGDNPASTGDEVAAPTLESPTLRFLPINLHFPVLVPIDRDLPPGITPRPIALPSEPSAPADPPIDPPSDPSAQTPVDPPTDPNATPEVPILPLPPAPAFEPGVRVVNGTADCAEAFPLATTESFRIDSMDDRTYAVGSMSVSAAYALTSVTLTATKEIFGVIVKGGTDANAYTVLANATPALTTPTGTPIALVTLCYAP